MTRVTVRIAIFDRFLYDRRGSSTIVYEEFPSYRIAGNFGFVFGTDFRHTTRRYLVGHGVVHRVTLSVFFKVRFRVGCAAP